MSIKRPLVFVFVILMLCTGSSGAFEVAVPKANPAIAVAPMNAVFFSLYKGETAEKSVNLLNLTKEPIRILRVESPSRRFTTHLETIKEGWKYKLVVTVRPDDLPGRTMEKATLLTDSSKWPKVEVGVNIFVKREVYTFPDDINFGTVDLDRIRKEPQMLNLLIQSILVKQREGKGKNFQITLQYTLPFIAVKKTPASGSETYRLDVSLIPEKMTRGKFDSFITVRTNDKKVPELKIPVRAVIR